MFPSNKRLLKELGKDYAEKLKYFLRKENRNASGNLSRSIQPRVRRINGELKILIESEPYLKWVDEGRRPGKYAPVRAIENWVRIRNIRWENAAFLINRKIFREGIRPSNVIQKTSRYWTMDNSYTTKYEEIIAKDMEEVFYIVAKEMGEPEPNTSIITNITNWLKKYL